MRPLANLHLEGRTLTAVRDPCRGEDAGPPFFLEAAPAGAPGGERREFAFGERGARIGGYIFCLSRRK